MLFHAFARREHLAVERRLHIVQQFRDLDFLGLEADLIAVAKAELDRGACPRRLRHDWLEPAPIAHDLIEPFLAVVLVAGAILLDQFAPELSGSIVLPAVVDVGNSSSRFALPGIQIFSQTSQSACAESFTGEMSIFAGGVIS